MTHPANETESRVGVKPVLVYLLACLAVFILPFLFPPRLLLGMSVSNQVGFNNKVAAIVAALISLAVFAYTLRVAAAKGTKPPPKDFGALSRWLVLLACVACAAFYIVSAVLVFRSGLRYPNDADYFVAQIRSYIDYGRLPYEQIEFPYGPALFYLPVFCYRLLSPFHVSVRAAYFITLTVQHVIGLLCVAYLADRLPIQRKAKTLLFLACSVGVIQINLGPNYSYFRFALPPALLLFAMRRSSPWACASALVTGQLISLGISAEFGAAYLAGALVYGIFRSYAKGLKWAVAIAAPLAGTAIFFLLVNRNYLHMLSLFAGGIYNFPVEPLPHILIFLIPLVLINPYGLAVFVRERRPEVPALAALCVFSIGLLPVAFGRADPAHVMNDGLMVMVLSLAFVTTLRQPVQKIWLIATLLFFIYGTAISALAYEPASMHVLWRNINGYEAQGTRGVLVKLLRTASWSKAKASIKRIDDPPPLDIVALRRIVGSDQVVLPYFIPFLEEEKLRQAGLFAPTFYDGMYEVWDRTAEQHEAVDINQYRWLLLPDDFPKMLNASESPGNTAFAMGLQITYPAKHTPYVVGPAFKQNLDTNWKLRARLGEYLLFEHR